MRWLDNITDSGGHEFEQTLRRWWRTEEPGMLWSMGWPKLDMTHYKNNNRVVTLNYFCSFPPILR